MLFFCALLGSQTAKDRMSCQFFLSFFFSILLIFKPQFCVAITNDLLHLSCTERSSIPLDMRIYP